MRRKNPVADLVFTELFSQPGEHDPQNWSQHLTRNLVAEVRLETHRFYGSLDTVEAKYPGLNYTFAPHMKRLSYWPHHARLFEAFKSLGLTAQEILTLCRWEGTLWARQRYEQDEGMKVEDTTGNEIKPWQQKEALQEQKEVSLQDIESRAQPSRHEQRRLFLRSHAQAEPQSARRISSQSPLSLQLQATRPADSQQPAVADGLPARDVEMLDGGADGVHIPRLHNAPASETLRRMQMLVAMHERGELLDSMNPELEQLFKDSLEAQSTGESANATSSLQPGYQGGAPLSAVANPLAQAQALSTLPSTQSDGAHSLPTARPPEIDAR